MINALLLFPAMLSMIVLAAHFLRAGHLSIVLLVLAAIPPLFVQKPWASRLMQGVLVLGGLEWVRTTLLLARFRAEAGVPYARMVVILGAVALVAVVAALLFETRRLRTRFNRT